MRLLTAVVLPTAASVIAPVLPEFNVSASLAPVTAARVIGPFPAKLLSVTLDAPSVSPDAPLKLIPPEPLLVMLPSSVTWPPVTVRLLTAVVLPTAASAM